MYNEFEQTLNKCLSLDILNVLCWTSFWFEEKRASLFETQQAHIVQYDIHPFIETVNYFLSQYLFVSKEKIASTRFHDEQDIEALAVAMKEAVANPDYLKNPVWSALNQAHTYYQFLKSTVEIYSFDLNYDINIENNIATLKYISEAELKRWFIENNKLSAWYDYYRTLAAELVNHEITQNPNFIKNTRGIDYEMNYEGAIRNTIARIIADDFSIIQSTLGGVPSESILTILNGFVSNAWGRYVTPMDKLNFNKPKMWLRNIVIIAASQGEIVVDENDRRLSALPTRFSSEEFILDMINNNLDNSEGYAKSLLNLISFDIQGISTINRLRPLFNLTGKPFIKLNNFYFSFNGILGESNSQVNTLVSVMESNSQAHSAVTKSEVELMEKSIGDFFIQAGFNNVVTGVEFKSVDGTQGDFDIAVYENGVLLLIELKRSKFRIHLSEVHDEYENSLSKASKQLSKAQSYIANNFKECKEKHFSKLNIKENELSEIKFYPFIVSTSFEHDHCMIDQKHFKLSLFELRNVLELKIDAFTGNKLEDLIMFIIRNEYWRPIENDFGKPDLERYILKMPL